MKILSEVLSSCMLTGGRTDIHIEANRRTFTTSLLTRLKAMKS
jgi:hypothetical protein